METRIEGIGSIFKMLAAILLLLTLGGLYYLVQTVKKDFGAENSPSQERLAKLAKEDELLQFEPGQEEFHRALEFIATGRIDEAVEKLTFIQKLHPNSISGPEARRILGEIKLDRLLSIENMENKKRHIVGSGDSFLKIARQYETTLDHIMFLNGLMEIGRLHPGDDILVMPLRFSLVIDVARSRIELFDQEELVKEYAILKMNLPRLGSSNSQSKISYKVGEFRGRPYQPAHNRYRRGLKVLGLSIKGSKLQIRPVPQADEEDPGRGVFLSKNDMEELAMLIRLGNEVEIRPAG